MLGTVGCPLGHVPRLRTATGPLALGLFTLISYLGVGSGPVSLSHASSRSPAPGEVSTGSQTSATFQMDICPGREVFPGGAIRRYTWSGVGVGGGVPSLSSPEQCDRPEER